MQRQEHHAKLHSNSILSSGLDPGLWSCTASVGGLATLNCPRCKWVCTWYPVMNWHPSLGVYSHPGIGSVSALTLTRRKWLLKMNERIQLLACWWMKNHEPWSQVLELLPVIVSLQQRIIGGPEVKLYSIKYQASLQYNNQHYCGGTLIHPQWVVSAAHCWKPWVLQPRQIGFNPADCTLVDSFSCLNLSI